MANPFRGLPDRQAHALRHTRIDPAAPTRRHVSDRRISLVAYDGERQDETSWPLNTSLQSLNFEAAWRKYPRFAAWRGSRLIYNGPVLNALGLPIEQHGGAA